jgi:hypothetical protein
VLHVVALDQILHDKESFSELFERPKINLLLLIVFHFNLRFFLPLLEQLTCILSFLAPEAIISDASSELEFKLDLFAQLLGNFISLNNLRFNISFNLHKQSFLLFLVLLLSSFSFLNGFLLLNPFLIASFLPLHLHDLQFPRLSGTLFLLIQHLLVLSFFPAHFCFLPLHVLAVEFDSALLF